MGEIVSDQEEPINLSETHQGYDTPSDEELERERKEVVMRS